jgi:hypothetical protein
MGVAGIVTSFPREPAVERGRHLAEKQRVRVIAVLAERGVLAPGTELEVVPEALPPDAASRDPRAFRARVGDPRSPRRSLVWELDGRNYSPTELTCKLWGDHGVASVGPSYYSHWRVVGGTRSLWEEAQALNP